MGEEKRAFKGLWICAAIFLDQNLTPAEKILLTLDGSFRSDTFPIRTVLSRTRTTTRTRTIRRYAMSFA